MLDIIKIAFSNNVIFFSVQYEINDKYNDDHSDGKWSIDDTLNVDNYKISHICIPIIYIIITSFKSSFHFLSSFSFLNRRIHHWTIISSKTELSNLMLILIYLYLLILHCWNPLIHYLDILEKITIESLFTFYIFKLSYTILKSLFILFIIKIYYKNVL